MMRLVSAIFFSVKLSFLLKCLGRNGESKYANCTIQDLIARTNDFLMLLLFLLSMYLNDTFLLVT